MLYYLQEKDKRFLLCPALVTIGCLKKFVQHKFDLATHLQVGSEDYIMINDNNMVDVT